MRISVIIPCLNAASTIAQQLEALARQSVQPWEVIVADNGSTDQTREIAQQCAELFSKFRIVNAADRKGAAHARNVGARAATGDYLAFCDADDVVSQDWLLALQSAFNKHNFLASRFDYKLLNGDLMNHNQDSGLQNFRIPFLPYAGGCGLGITRTLHEAVSGFDEDMLYTEDADYCLRVQLLGEPLVFVPDALIHIRYSSNLDTSFIATRKACFRHAFNWGHGFATIYGRYREKGMKAHGIAPRLALICLWILRSILSGFSYRSMNRLGWHAGAVSGLLQLHTSNASSHPPQSVWSSSMTEN